MSCYSGTLIRKYVLAIGLVSTTSSCFLKQAVNVNPKENRTLLKVSEDFKLVCQEIAAFPGFKLDQKVDCQVTVNGSNSKDAQTTLSNFTLEGCSMISLNRDSGSISGRMPIRNCTGKLSALHKDQLFETEIVFRSKNKVRHLGRDNKNAPIFSYSFGIEKINNQYWSHGPTGLNVFDNNLKFVKSYTKLTDRLPADRIDSMTHIGSQIFIGTTHGLARSTDGGKTWSKMDVYDSLGKPTYFNGLTATSSKLVGFSGSTLYIMNHDGSSISELVPGISVLPSGSINSVKALSNTIYVNSSTGVHYTSNDGQSWQSYVTPQLADLTVYDLYELQGVLYFSTEAGISKFDGSSWSTIAPASLPGGFAVNGIGKTRVDGNRMMVLTFNYPSFVQPRLGLSSDGGSSWTHIDNYPRECPAPRGHGQILEGSRILLGGPNGMLVSEDFGSSWRCVSRGGNLGAEHVWLLREGDDLFVSSWGNGFWKGSLKSSDWKSYHNIRRPGENDLSLGFYFGPSMVKSGNEFFVHRWLSNGIDYSNDGGNTFSFINTVSAGISYFAKLELRNGALYGSGYGSGFGKSLDKGQTWTVVKTPQGGLPNDTILNFAFDKTGKIFAATFDGLAISSDDGANWQVKRMAQGMPNASINGVIELDGTIVAWSNESKDFALSTDGGTTFKLIDLSTLGLPSDIVHGMALYDGVIYAGLGKNTFAMSIDQGKTWEFILDSDTSPQFEYRKMDISQDRFLLVSESALSEFH